MPYIQIDLNQPVDPDTSNRLHAGTLAIMRDVLNKDPALTAISLRAVAAEHWSVGGDTAAATAFVRAHVTEGSNTPEEIEAAIAAFHQLLVTVITDFDPVSYVVIDTVPAGHWGWGGRSQAARRPT